MLLLVTGYLLLVKPTTVNHLFVFYYLVICPIARSKFQLTSNADEV